jgi:DMSO/TMAO reductase YedYZ molybdopterin-dependent catalytic subunit
MMEDREFLDEHVQLTRRFFLRAGVLGVAASPVVVRSLRAEMGVDEPKKRAKPDKAGAQPEPYFTASEDFGDVSRGTPRPFSLSEEKKKEVGLTRDTWRLEVIADPDRPAKLDKPLTKTSGTALDFATLLKLGEKHAVRFPKIMTCLNLGCPLGMGLWEGVPLREIVWLAQPRENVRRVFYYGYHNDDPKQMFRSSLPIGRVLEDPFDLPPVILCYKLNGEWLDSRRGGPVRIVVPECYGFKSIKWLTHVVLTNLATANDTYAEQNNDVDSPLKTFAATLSISREVKAGERMAVSGYAQVGISGLAKVQVSIESNAKPRPDNDPYFLTAPWVDAKLLAAPKRWEGLGEGKVPGRTHGFDAAGEPKTWPMRLTKAHWAAVLPGLAKGEYTFRCRTIDDKGQAQPMPRPFRKSGHSAIESIAVTVKD